MRLSRFHVRLALETFLVMSLGVAGIQMQLPPDSDDNAAAIATFGAEKDGVYIMKERKEHRTIKASDYEELRIFCHLGRGPELVGFWSAAEMRLKIDGEDYNVYMAENVSMVQELHKEHASTWFYSSLPWKSKTMRLNPFEAACVGVLTREEYTLTLQKFRVNYWQVVMTLVGLALFVYAPSLCRNAFFHYTTGVAAGVFLSLVVVSYLVQRRFNLGKMALACYSLSIYFLTTIWYNLRQYVMENHVYVLGYLVVTALASFAVCYRMGPVSNPRTINLIQWTMQLAAMVLIYLSSYHQVASLSLCIGILVWSLIPDTFKTQVQVQYHKNFVKPKIRLLSEAEYHEETVRETEKALKELREFCQSPKCNAWKHISSLKSPTRFAEFVQGSSHISQDEIMDYSNTSDFEDELERSFDGAGGGDDAEPGHPSDANDVTGNGRGNQPQFTDDDSSDDTTE